MKKKHIILIVCASIAILAVILSSVFIINHVNQLLEKTAEESARLAKEETTEFDHQAEVQTLLSQGYVPLEETMRQSGYTLEDGVFEKENAGVEIVISFDLDQEICRKNDYRFSLVGKLYVLRGKVYIQADFLEQITNDVYSVDAAGDVVVTPIENVTAYEAHPWTTQRVISHAGGGYRDTNGGYISYYTNSMEALKQNYNLGSRVFEFDFALTTDGRLAAVHDWENFANKDGSAVSSEEWEQLPVGAKPETEGTYTSMFVEDILDEMLVNRDMYLVTDMKLDGLSEDEIYTEFETLCQAARQKDPSLLERIVPQVYDMEMYDEIMQMYEFPSVIFTCYRTQENADAIIDFCASKDNIHVITSKYDDARFGEMEIAKAHEQGLLVYNYTVSGFTKMYECFSIGVDGIYSNSLLPQDITVYNEAGKDAPLEETPVENVQDE